MSLCGCCRQFELPWSDDDTSQKTKDARQAKKRKKVNKNN